MSLLDFDVVAPSQQLVPPDGPTDARIVIIGEAPAKEELKQLKPLVGPTGQALNEYLHSIQVLRSKVYTTNLFKFAVNKLRTPERLFKDSHLVWKAGTGFTPLGEESREELLLELQELSPNVIVPLGGPALEGLMSLKGIRKYRGSILWHEELQCKVIPTLHPASAFHDNINSFLISYDFQKVKEQMYFPELKLTPRNYRIFPTFDEVIAFLEDIIKNKRQPVSFDLETTRNQVTHIAVGWSATEAMSIQFFKHNKDVFTTEQELTIWETLTEILESTEIKKEGQNLTYDNGFLFKRLGIVVRNFDDSMIGIKTAYPQLRMGIDTIASIYTDMPYYKNEGKQHNKIRDEAEYATYNAKDAITVSDAMPLIKRDLDQLHNRTTYEIQKSLVPVILYMGQRGIRVDEGAFAKVEAESRQEASQLQQELNDLVGFELNVRSTKQLQTYFYDNLGIRPYMKNSRPTVNEEALMRLAAGTTTRAGLREAELVLSIRQLLNKVSKEYALAFESGRLTSAYKPVTATGRLSSEKDVFGQGTNVQNRQGKLVNKYFLADEGYVLFNVDYSQADNRSVAYMAPEGNMIEAFETGVDIHSKTAALIFNLDAAEVKRQDIEKIKCPVGNGSKTYRAWGKMCNHALNFGMGVNKFALNIGVNRTLAKRLYEAYHNVYPGVVNGYQNWIRRSLYGQTELPARRLVNCFGRIWLYMGSLRKLTEAYAFPAQSNTADAINRFGLIPLYYNEKFKYVDLLRQVHDSIDFQIPKSVGINAMADLLREIKSTLETPIHWKGRDFILPAEFSAGLALYPMTDLNFKQDLVPQLRQYF